MRWESSREHPLHTRTSLCSISTKLAEYRITNINLISPFPYLTSLNRFKILNMHYNASMDLPHRLRATTTPTPLVLIHSVLQPIWPSLHCSHRTGPFHPLHVLPLPRHHLANSYLFIPWVSVSGVCRSQHQFLKDTILLCRHSSLD